MSQKHNPEFIAEMKTKLTAEKKHLEQELNIIGSKFPEYGRNEEDNATEITDYQATSATENTLEARLKSVAQALGRIENSTYGITDTGELIPEARLRANPAATTLIK